MALALMSSASALAYWATPRALLADKLPPLDLDALIPRAFGEWRMDPSAAILILDPQTQATIKSVYDQTLSRTYIGPSGQRIMLSIAYGRNQTDTGVSLHYPEVCYPAQGFRIHSNDQVSIETPYGHIPARNLETSFSSNRFEPVTYWTMIGLRAAYGGTDKKLAEMRHSLKGEIADGMLVRVSSITRDSAKAWVVHQAFVSSLLAAVSPEQRLRLSGL